MIDERTRNSEATSVTPRSPKIWPGALPRISGRLALILALALLPALGLTQTFGCQVDPPNGLVAVIKYDPTAPLDLKPFSNPYVSGVALQIHWSDIEPTEGKPDWCRLDELLFAATWTHKWIHLLIFPGFWSPKWALVGAQTDYFTVQYGPGKGECLPLPMPWDPVYLRNSFCFVRRLSDRYREVPALTMVAVAGPTSVSDEFTEPRTKQEIAQWIADDFTSTKYIDAWQQAFEEYGNDFPHQYLSLSHGDGLPINAEGMRDPAAQEQERTAIVNGGIETLTDRFDFQSSALRGVPHHLNAIAMVERYIGKCSTGFQCGTSCQNDPVGTGGTICKGNPPLALTRTLDRGLQTNAAGQHVNYIEIYSEDIEAADMQTVLQWGASQF